MHPTDRGYYYGLTIHPFLNSLSFSFKRGFPKKSKNYFETFTLIVHTHCLQRITFYHEIDLENIQERFSVINPYPV